MLYPEISRENRGLPTGTFGTEIKGRPRLDGFTEISAVCTASEFRGQGLGRTLVEALSSMLISEGRTPFLHVKTENGAKQLYERIGFRVRRKIRLTVISRSS